MKFDFDATAIGSLPFTDPKKACRLILDTFPVIPFWPQLPKRSFRENMYVQYAEGFPGAVVDESKKTIHVDTAKASDELEGFFRKYLDGDLDYFAISESRAAGLYEFLGAAGAGERPPYVKGHITGPISYALTVTDQNRRSILYDNDLFEATAKVLVMKARWQIAKLAPLAGRVIIFIDEPYLVSIGSSYVTIDLEAAGARLDELIDAIHADGALVGVHCCGNTDWPFLLKRRIDILNFDAYNFTKELSLYAVDIDRFTAAGGAIAWGIVPSTDAIDAESELSIARKLEGALDTLAAKGVDMKRIQSLVTPSCGVGSLDDARAEKALKMTGALSVLAKRAARRG